MENIQDQKKVAGQRKVAKALQNSTVSKDGTWRTFKDVPCVEAFQVEHRDTDLPYGAMCISHYFSEHRLERRVHDRV